MAERMMPQKLNLLVQKYKYAAIILLIGLALMLLPGREEVTPGTGTEETVESRTGDDLEARLEALLGQISGVGRVQVLLTVDTGEETVFQSDTKSDSSDTVIVEDSDRVETGLVRRVDATVYRGAVIVCEGADQASVRLAVVEAVACATGLRSDQISVVKMN